MDKLQDDSRYTYMLWHGATFSDGQNLGLKADQELYLGHGWYLGASRHLWCLTGLVNSGGSYQDGDILNWRVVNAPCGEFIERRGMEDVLGLLGT